MTNESYKNNNKSKKNRISRKQQTKKVYSLHGGAGEEKFLGPNMPGYPTSANDLDFDSEEGYKGWKELVKPFWEVSNEVDLTFCKYTVFKCNIESHKNLNVIALYDVKESSLTSYWSSIKHISTRVIISLMKTVPVVGVACLAIFNPLSYISAGTAAVVGLGIGVVSFYTFLLSWAEANGIRNVIGTETVGLKAPSEKTVDLEVVNRAANNRDKKIFSFGSLNYQEAWRRNNGYIFIKSIAKTLGLDKAKRNFFGIDQHFDVDCFSTCENATSDLGWLFKKTFNKEKYNDILSGSRMYGGTDGRKLEYDLFSKYKGVFLMYYDDKIGHERGDSCYQRKPFFYKNNQGNITLVDESGKEINPSCLTKEEKDTIQIKELRVNHACGESNIFGFVTLKSLLVELLNLDLVVPNNKNNNNDEALTNNEMCKKKNDLVIDKFLCSHALPHRMMVGDPIGIYDDELRPCVRNILDKFIYDAFGITRTR